MRALLVVLVLALAAAPALADECGDLIDKVTAETAARPRNRSSDYASFSAGPA